MNITPQSNPVQRRTALSVIGCAVLLVTATVGGVLLAAPAGAQPTGNYDVSIGYPTDFAATDNQTIRVVVDNTGNSDDVFNPVIEVPLPSGISASAGATETAYVTLPDGTTENRRAEVQNSTYRSGDAFFIYGENVPAGEVRTYHLNLTVASSGQQTLDAEVRPLYNEDVTVRAENTSYAAGFGQLDVNVQNPDGSAVSAATITVDDEPTDGASVSTDVREGAHTINVTGVSGVPLPTLNDTVGVGETTTITYIARDTATSPSVVARTGSAQVVDPSVGRVTTQPTAVQPKVENVSFLVDMAGGNAVVALEDPATVGPVSDRTATSDAASLARNTTDGTSLLTIENGDDAEVALEIVGYRLGDATKDGVVGAADASAVANVTVTGEATDQYSDVNGDGTVDAVDAMLIAQYDAENRDADYERGGA